MLQKKREIVIAGILFACLLTAALLCVLVTDFVGKPVLMGGDLKNIKVSITEVCSKNQSIICDANGVYSDYIELYNDGEAFDLERFVLTDNKNSQLRYVFESRTFKKGEYIIVFLDGKTVPFSLKSEGGEWVYLLAPDGTEIDYVETVPTESNYVYSLQDGIYVVTADASPGFPNTADGVKAFKNSLNNNAAPLVINEILFSNKSVLPDKNGNFSDIVEIANISNTEVSTGGWYLSDDTADPHKFALRTSDCSRESFWLFLRTEPEIRGRRGARFVRLLLREPAVLSDISGRYASVEYAFTEDNASYCRVTKTVS
jgi:hypothetical protein